MATRKLKIVDAPPTGQQSLGGPPTTSTTPTHAISGTLLIVGIASGTSLVLINILIIGCCLHKRNTKQIKRGKNGRQLLLAHTLWCVCVCEQLREHPLCPADEKWMCRLMNVTIFHFVCCSLFVNFLAFERYVARKFNGLKRIAWFLMVVVFNKHPRGDSFSFITPLIAFSSLPIIFFGTHSELI